MNPLDHLDHRPWDLPASRWTMTQTWHNLLFAHWSLSPDALRQVIPSELELDTFDGEAWLGIIPFRLSGVRLRGWPAMPFVSGFPEINVRTYVVRDGKPGVYFMSLDADNPLGIMLARPWFRLAYHYSRINVQAVADKIRFDSHRKAGSGSRCADFKATYGHCHEPPFLALPGTLEHWLTERYCYYSVSRSHRIYRCDTHHEPWPLQRAQALIGENTMSLSHGISLPDREPLLHYSRYMKALVWRVRECY